MDAFVAALRDPACYPHAVDEVALIETHISWVLLAGPYAYKVKKPVRLPFLDFSTLAARRRFCEEELRINRRTAPDLYLDVVPVVRRAGGFAVGAHGEAVEYAVRMRRFASDALADAMAKRGRLGAREADAIADAVARFHGRVPQADPAAGCGTPAAVAQPALANFEQIAALGLLPRTGPRLERLRAWTAEQCRALEPQFTARLAGGRVRECHGDLHLGNIAFIDGKAVPFDGIEFDPALRWIDVMSEVAFLVMDLIAHGLPGLAWRLLNAWLEATGDYEGIAVLRFYLVYRAIVRAKVARIGGDDAACRLYLRLAESLSRDLRPALVLMQGLSGSGKTTVSQVALERLRAVRVRSDVERKRLHGLAPGSRAGERPGAGIYAEAASAQTYGRLGKIAAIVLQAGYPAIVDAAFLARSRRSQLRSAVAKFPGPWVIAACNAPEETLRRRVAEREALAGDASDAGEAVLERQFALREEFDAEEAAHAVVIGTASSAGTRAGIARLAQRLGQAEDGVAAL